MAIDKYDWHYNSAVEIYCDETGRTEEQLTDDDYGIIESRAAAHIGFFAAWLIKHDLYSTEGAASADSIEAVKNESMTGTQFFMSECDGKLWDDDISEKLLPFIEDFYQDYISSYTDYISEQLNKSVYSFEGSWDDYRTVEKLIDRLYAEYN